MKISNNEFSQTTVLLRITIYCNVCCLNVVNTQSLHHKIDWTWIIHFSFSYFNIVIRGVAIFFTLLPKPIFPYEISFYQILQYCNILQYTQTQYAIQHLPKFFHPQCVCVYVCVSVCVCLCLCLYVCVYLYVCMYVAMYEVYVDMYVSIYWLCNISGVPRSCQH